MSNESQNDSDLTTPVVPMKQNGFIAQAMLDLMKIPTATPEALRQMPFIIQNYVKYQAEREKINQIMLQLEYSGINSDLKKHENKEMNFSNLVVMSTFMLSLFKFKRWSNKIIFCGATLCTKSFFLDYYCMNRYLKRVGLEESDIISQEVRLLYRFYFPDEKISQDFIPICQRFQKVQEIRKAIHLAKNKL